MHEPLKSCPFCGSKAVASINKSESLWSHNIVDWTRVHCTNDDCNAQTEPTCDGYEPSAIEVWNRRAPQPVARVPLTDAQITVDGLMMTPNSVLENCATAFEAGVRFAERAHGIGTEKGDSHGLPT